MNHRFAPLADRSPTARRWLWLAIVLLGGVFFFVEHRIDISRYETYAPWTDSGGSLENGRNMAKGLTLAMLGAVGLWLALRSDGPRLRFNGWLPPLIICYLAWLATSLFWSVDPGMSCRRLPALLCCLAAAVGFGRHLRPRDLPAIAIVVGCAYFAVGVCAELALGTFRPWMPDYRFAGTIHPNAQGAGLAIVCLAAFCFIRCGDRRSGWLYGCVAVGIVFLMLTKSRASCASMLVAMGAVWFATASARSRLLAALTAGLVVSTVALAASVSSRDELADRLLGAVMLGRQEQSEGLSGRLPLWEDLAGYARERPLQGYGYQAFWNDKTIDNISDDMEWTMREAHNGYLDTVLAVGLVGGALLLTIMLVGLRKAILAYRQTGDAGLAFILGLLVFCLSDGFFESGVPNFTAVLAEIGFVQLMAFRAAVPAPAKRTFSTWVMEG